MQSAPLSTATFSAGRLPAGQTSSSLYSGSIKDLFPGERRPGKFSLAMAAALQLGLQPIQDVPFLRTPGWSKQDVFRCSAGDAVIYDIGRRALDQVSRDPDVIGHFQRLIFAARLLGSQHGMFEHV